LDRVQGKTGQNALSKRLAAFVKDWSDNSHTQYDTNVELGDKVPAISEVSIARRRDSDPHEWQWRSCGVTVAPISAEALQQRITAKEVGYQKYRACCAECWLVVVCDRNDYAMAAGIEVSPEAVANVYRSSFDRVFFLQVRRKLFKMSTR
jgi:hypothetical protein